HREPRAAPRRRSRLPEQAVIDQLARGVQHGYAKAGRLGADALDDIKGDAAAKDRAGGQQLPSRIAQQLVAPRYGRPQRPLAGPGSRSPAGPASCPTAPEFPLAAAASPARPPAR